MTISKEKLLAIGFAAFFALPVLFFFAQPTNANPSNFVRKALSDATATTTRSYMTAGTATTTLTFDTGSSIVASVDSATLLMCLTASSTATVLNTNIEYSHDSRTWYSDNLSDLSTTTPAFFVQNAQSFTYTYASTTQGGAGVSASSNVGCRALTIATPTRYVRAFFTLTGTNGAIYAEIIGKRQSN